MNWLKKRLAIAAMMTLASTAHASLVSLGNGTVLDTTTHLVWLQDWNVNGSQNWVTQVAWANNLVFGGSSDWFLPGGDAYGALSGEVGNLATAQVFTDVQSYYWTNESYISGTARFFFVPNGNTYDYGDATAGFSAVAVRNATAADVIPAVPEPQTLAMIVLGLGAAVVVRSRRQR